MQHDHPILGIDLIDQMGCPEDGQPPLRHQATDIAQQFGAAADVEADRRLVAEQEPRLMQQGARDLDPPELAARQLPHLAPDLPGKPRARQLLPGPAPAVAKSHAVEGGVIDEVLSRGQVEIEGALLEDDAQQGKCGTGCARRIMAEDADRAGLGREQSRDEGEQGRLPRAVRPEQDDESPGGQGYVDIRQSLALAVAIGKPADLERGAAPTLRPRPGRFRYSRAAGAHLLQSVRSLSLREKE